MWLAPKGNPGSRLFTDVKPGGTGLISGWVTIWIDFKSNVSEAGKSYEQGQNKNYTRAETEKY